MTRYSLLLLAFVTLPAIAQEPAATGPTGRIVGRIIDAQTGQGIPHAAINEDIYKGKLIPAGSVVIANIWFVLIDISLPCLTQLSRAMMRDEKYFPNSEIFDPDRYSSKAAESDNKHVHRLNVFRPDDPSSLLFGFGRR